MSMSLDSVSRHPFPEGAIKTSSQVTKPREGAIGGHDVSQLSQETQRALKSTQMVINSVLFNLESFLNKEIDPLTKEKVGFPSESMAMLTRKLNAIGRLLSKTETDSAHSDETAHLKNAKEQLTQTMDRFRSEIPSSPKFFNSFKNFSDFINFKNLRELKYSLQEREYAMKDVPNSQTAPINNRLNKSETDLVSHYTEEGYYNMNDVLTGNFSDIATHFLEHLGETSVAGLAEDKNQVRELGNQYPMHFGNVQVHIEQEKVFVTLNKDVDDPSKGTLTFELNQKTKGQIVDQMKNALIQASELNKTLEKLPKEKHNILYRRVRLSDEGLMAALSRYNPQGRSLPPNKMVDLSQDKVFVQENRFTSTTSDYSAINDFGGSIEFLISSDDGRAVHGYTDKDEKEVILNAGSKLQIIGMMKKELPDNDEIIIISCRQIR